MCQHVLQKVMYTSTAALVTHSLWRTHTAAVCRQPISVLKRQLFSLSFKRENKTRLCHSAFFLIWCVQIASVSSLLYLHSLILFVSFLLSDAAVCPLCVGGPVNSLPLLSSLSFTKTSNEFCLHKQTHWNDHKVVCKRFLFHLIRRETVETIVNMFSQNKADYLRNIQCHLQILNVSSEPFQ